MEKLTLENIACYLPYGLRVIRVNENSNTYANPGPYTIIGADINNVYYLNGSGFQITNAKPILRPMDLTNPIEIDGKEIIPVCELCKISYGSDYEDRDYDENELCEMEQVIISLSYFTDTLTLDNAHWLFKHHFDVFGLIERGLAIDINKL